jgi:uncharacterized protein DUF2442
MNALSLKSSSGRHHGARRNARGSGAPNPARARRRAGTGGRTRDQAAGTRARARLVNDAVDVKCTDDELIVTLVDGRRVSAPLAWFPRLLRATPKQRANSRHRPRYWNSLGRCGRRYFGSHSSRFLSSHENQLRPRLDSSRRGDLVSAVPPRRTFVWCRCGFLPFR